MLTIARDYYERYSSLEFHDSDKSEDRALKAYLELVSKERGIVSRPEEIAINAISLYREIAREGVPAKYKLYFPENSQNDKI